MGLLTLCGDPFHRPGEYGFFFTCPTSPDSSGYLLGGGASKLANRVSALHGFSGLAEPHFCHTELLPHFKIGP